MLPVINHLMAYSQPKAEPHHNQMNGIKEMRGDRRISLRLFFLLLLSGGLMGWMMLVIAGYYFVRIDENQWVNRNIEVLSTISPAAGGNAKPVEEARDKAATDGAAAKPAQ